MIKSTVSSCLSDPISFLVIEHRKHDHNDPKTSNRFLFLVGRKFSNYKVAEKKTPNDLTMVLIMIGVSILTFLPSFLLMFLIAVYPCH